MYKNFIESTIKMSESSAVEVSGGELQDFTIDQLAGAFALSLGAVGTLLLVIWQSRCACRCRLGFSDKCYIFDCERTPPPDEEGDDKKDTPVEDSQEPSPEPEPEPEPIMPQPDPEQPPQPADAVEEVVEEIEPRPNP